MQRGGLAAALGLVAVLAGCDRQTPRKPPGGTIRLATTTSTESSGLLDVLLPAFRKKTGIQVQVMPMGTGKALRTGRDGNCDVVLVHAPQAEREFVREGSGVDRRPVMYNDFVILGPASDPAGVKGTSSASEALGKIHAAKAPFVSRGDQSGTHRKEAALWRGAGLSPQGRWYRSVGKGMGEALIMASQMRAYTLADRGSFLKLRRKINLAVLVAGGEAMRNPYAVIAVNPGRWTHVRHDLATKLIEFLVSAEGQRLIGDYRIDGEVLFHPWPKPAQTKPSEKGAGSP